MIDYTSRASIGLLKRIPSGFVRLGSRFHPRENPPRAVRILEFQMAHVPVTVSQYEVFLQSGAANEPKWWSDAGWQWRQGKSEGWGRVDRAVPNAWKQQLNRSDHPVTGVTWFEAEAYCRWIASAKQMDVRLPDEAEWERAARGDDTRPFPWGEEFDEQRTNTLESQEGTTLPASRMISDISPFGIYEMAGNVQQWTKTVYTPLPGETYSSPDLRVARGGSFNDTAFGARTSYRRAYPPGYFYPFLGFRVIVAPHR